MDPFIWLASNSPRRRQLLAWTGWPFEVNPVDVDESRRTGESPLAYVGRVALDKAQALSGRLPQGSQGIVLAADTIVVDGEAILGKPSGPDEARRMLHQLRAHQHQVYTAISLFPLDGSKVVNDLCATDAPMRAYSDQEVEQYIASGDPLDKAGAYAIQHPGFHPVENLAGCYAGVMGLPLCHVVRSMARLGVRPSLDVAQACQSALHYACPVFHKILEG